MTFKNNPKVIWLTGLSGSGKTFLANIIYKYLNQKHFKTYMIDGDVFRAKYSLDLSFSKKDISENIKRIYTFAKQNLNQDFYVIVAVISPFAKDREDAKNFIGKENFIEIYLSASISTCEGRDVKRLYKKARNNEIINMAGIHFSYEPPLNPDIVFNSSNTEIVNSEEFFLNLERLI